jgi:hypothetical protein
MEKVKGNLLIKMELTKEFSEGTKRSIHKFKRLSKKISIKVHRMLDPTDRSETRSGEAEKDASVIFRKMIKCQESELLMSPISQKQYVRNDEKRILLILDNTELTVINHVFSYNIRISQKTNKSLNEAFNIELEKRRLEMEVSFKENVKHSLKTILVKIDE